LHQADTLDAAGDHNVGFACGNTIGCHGCSRNAGAAVSVDRYAGSADAEAGFESRVTRNVVTGRALGQTTTKNDILDFSGINQRALDSVSQDVRSHANTMCLVECAAAGLGDACAAIRNNGDVLHTTSQAFSVQARY
jgi:hypothetical protein